MATYKEIIGTNVESRSSDPSNLVEGQVWYNSTSGALKGASVASTGSWSTGGNMNTARVIAGAAGIKTSALVFGGKTPPHSALTESYNGTSWTEVSDLNTSRMALGGSGISNTSALAFGGSSPPNVAVTESWSGSSWTEVGDLNNARQLITAGGTQTSTLAFGGWNPYRAETESWNGSAWTEVADLNTARYYQAGSGADNTQGLCFGGIGPTPGAVAITESFNGSSWTEVADLNSARYALAGAGSATSALAFGAEPASALTELWNGSSWTEVADLSTGRFELMGNGTSNLGAFAAGGATSPPYANRTLTEEWTGAGATITRTFTTS
jgi:hypothetical protein